MSVRGDIINYIKAQVLAAPSDSPLYQAQVNFTPWQPYVADFGISVWYGEAGIVPNIGMTGVAETDGYLPIICYAAVKSLDLTDRFDADEKADAIAMALAFILYGGTSGINTLGGIVRDSRLGTKAPGHDAEKSISYATSTFKFYYNETGQSVI